MWKQTRHSLSCRQQKYVQWSCYQITKNSNENKQSPIRFTSRWNLKSLEGFCFLFFCFTSMRIWSGVSREIVCPTCYCQSAQLVHAVSVLIWPPDFRLPAIAGQSFTGHTFETQATTDLEKTFMPQLMIWFAQLAWPKKLALLVSWIWPNTPRNILIERGGVQRYVTCS